MPIYLRIAGSIFNCLRRWLDAVDIGDGEDESVWWTAPSPCMSATSKKQNEKLVGWKLRDMRKLVTSKISQFGHPFVIDFDFHVNGNNVRKLFLALQVRFSVVCL